MFLYRLTTMTNRNLLIRVPLTKNGQSNRIELRSPDNAANPYIAATLLTKAALDGIENGLKCEDYAEEGTLPQTLSEAVETAENSDFVKSVLPEHLVNCFLKAKRQDWEIVSVSDDPRKTAREMEFLLT